MQAKTPPEAPNLAAPPDQNRFEGWTFLTNHSLVIVCLMRHPGITLRRVAYEVGITERSVQRILSDLEEAGAVARSRSGRCNRYEVNLQFRLRHPLESEHTLEELLAALI